MTTSAVRIVLAALGFLGASVAAQPCEPHWSDQFPANELAGLVHEVCWFDDGGGAGPTLYAGGIFFIRDGNDALLPDYMGVARWEGDGWVRVGPDDDQLSVYAMAVYDDGGGGGPALYVAGPGAHPNNEVARWDPAAGVWQTIGVTQGGEYSTRSLAVFDDGSGPALYLGGGLQSINGVPANRVARWDGVSWSAVDLGTWGVVNALAALDEDGPGPRPPALYATGNFMLNGGPERQCLARLDGGSWTGLGTGPGVNGYSLAAFDDGGGGGTQLYVGGENLARLGRARVSRWDGSAWTPVGLDFHTSHGNITAAYALTVYDDGTGPALYAGGDFALGSTNPPGNLGSLARWTGAEWVPGGGGVSHAIRSMTLGDGGKALYVGGLVGQVGEDELTCSGAARFDGEGWSRLQTGVTYSAGADLAVFDDGSGEKLYVGGPLTVDTDDGPAQKLATWDGERWGRVGPELAWTFVFAMETFDDGSGPALYVIGERPLESGWDRRQFARWDGESWTILPSPLGWGVTRLLALDTGDRPRLVAVGTAAPSSGTYVGRWTGAAWETIVYEGTEDGPSDAAVYDDGRGQALYVVGDFDAIDGVPARNVARWDGSGWEPLGTGLEGWQVSRAHAFDSGQGAELYVMGLISEAGGLPVQDIARWNGTSWAGVGGGLQLASAGGAMDVFDDGTGPALYVAGDIFRAGAMPVRNIARWNGAEWSGVGTGMGLGGGSVGAFEVFDDGSGPALFMGGNFSEAGGLNSGRIAKWQGCPLVCRPDLNGDGQVNIEDVFAFLNAYATGTPSADFTGDGSVTVQDFLAFLNAYDAGC